MINRRLKAGRYASMREGRSTVRFHPMGMKFTGSKGEKGNSLRPVPKEAAVVQRVFREFLAGRTQSAIAAGLNRCGIPSARGKRWTVSSIQSLLRNAHYAGYTVSGFRPSKKILRNGQLVTTRPRNSDLQLYPGRHDALISKEDYHRAMEILRTHQAPPVPKKSGASNPLSGLVICSCCGKNMQGDLCRMVRARSFSAQPGAASQSPTMPMRLNRLFCRNFKNGFPDLPSKSPIHSTSCLNSKASAAHFPQSINRFPFWKAVNKRPVNSSNPGYTPQNFFKAVKPHLLKNVPRCYLLKPN